MSKPTLQDLFSGTNSSQPNKEPIVYGQDVLQSNTSVGYNPNLTSSNLNETNTTPSLKDLLSGIKVDTFMSTNPQDTYFPYNPTKQTLDKNFVNNWKEAITTGYDNWWNTFLNAWDNMAISEERGNFFHKERLYGLGGQVLSYEDTILDYNKNLSSLEEKIKNGDIDQSQYEKEFNKLQSEYNKALEIRNEMESEIADRQSQIDGRSVDKAYSLTSNIINEIGTEAGIFDKIYYQWPNTFGSSAGLMIPQILATFATKSLATGIAAGVNAIPGVGQTASGVIGTVLAASAAVGTLLHFREKETLAEIGGTIFDAREKMITKYLQQNPELKGDESLIPEDVMYNIKKKSKVAAHSQYIGNMMLAGSDIAQALFMPLSSFGKMASSGTKALSTASKPVGILGKTKNALSSIPKTLENNFLTKMKGFGSIGSLAHKFQFQIVSEGFEEGFQYALSKSSEHAIHSGSIEDHSNVDINLLDEAFEAAKSLNYAPLFFELRPFNGKYKNDEEFKFSEEGGRTLSAIMGGTASTIRLMSNLKAYREIKKELANNVKGKLFDDIGEFNLLNAKIISNSLGRGRTLELKQAIRALNESKLDPGKSDETVLNLKEDQVTELMNNIDTYVEKYESIKSKVDWIPSVMLQRSNKDFKSAKQYFINTLFGLDLAYNESLKAKGNLQASISVKTNELVNQIKQDNPTIANMIDDRVFDLNNKINSLKVLKELHDRDDLSSALGKEVGSKIDTEITNLEKELSEVYSELGVTDTSEVHDIIENFISNNEQNLINQRDFYFREFAEKNYSELYEKISKVAKSKQDLIKLYKESPEYIASKLKQELEKALKRENKNKSEKTEEKENSEKDTKEDLKEDEQEGDEDNELEISEEDDAEKESVNSSSYNSLDKLLKKAEEEKKKREAEKNNTGSENNTSQNNTQNNTQNNQPLDENNVNVVTSEIFDNLVDSVYEKTKEELTNKGYAFVLENQSVIESIVNQIVDETFNLLSEQDFVFDQNQVTDLKDKVISQLLDELKENVQEEIINDDIEDIPLIENEIIENLNQGEESLESENLQIDQELKITNPISIAYSLVRFDQNLKKEVRDANGKIEFHNNIVSINYGLLPTSFINEGGYVQFTSPDLNGKENDIRIDINYVDEKGNTYKIGNVRLPDSLTIHNFKGNLLQARNELKLLRNNIVKELKSGKKVYSLIETIKKGKLITVKNPQGKSIYKPIIDNNYSFEGFKPFISVITSENGKLAFDNNSVVHLPRNIINGATIIALPFYNHSTRTVEYFGRMVRRNPISKKSSIHKEVGKNIRSFLTDKTVKSLNVGEKVYVKNLTSGVGSIPELISFNTLGVSALEVGGNKIIKVVSNVNEDPTYFVFNGRKLFKGSQLNFKNILIDFTSLEEVKHSEIEATTNIVIGSLPYNVSSVVLKNSAKKGTMENVQKVFFSSGLLETDVDVNTHLKSTFTFGNLEENAFENKVEEIRNKNNALPEKDRVNVPFNFISENLDQVVGQYFMHPTIEFSSQLYSDTKGTLLGKNQKVTSKQTQQNKTEESQPTEQQKADIEKDQQGNFVPKKYTLNLKGENPSPNIPLSAISEESFGGELPTNIKQVKLLEIRGKNSLGQTVGEVWVQKEDGQSYTADVFFNDAELASLNNQVTFNVSSTPSGPISGGKEQKQNNNVQVEENKIKAHNKSSIGVSLVSDTTSNSLYKVNDKFYLRVTSLEEGIKFSKKDTVTNIYNAQTVGNFNDIFGRLFFEKVNTDEKVTIENFISEINSFKDFSKEQKELFVDLLNNSDTFKNIQEVYTKLHKDILKEHGNQKLTFVTNETFVYGDIDNLNYGLGGTLDIVVIDEKGNKHIYDLKTKNENSQVSESDMIKWTNQQSTYKYLAENKNNLGKFESINVLLVRFNYDKQSYNGKLADHNNFKPLPNINYVASAEIITLPYNNLSDEVIAKKVQDFNNDKTLALESLMNNNISVNPTEHNKQEPQKEETEKSILPTIKNRFSPDDISFLLNFQKTDLNLQIDSKLTETEKLQVIDAIAFISLQRNKENLEGGNVVVSIEEALDDFIDNHSERLEELKTKLSNDIKVSETLNDPVISAEIFKRRTELINYINKLNEIVNNDAFYMKEVANNLKRKGYSVDLYSEEEDESESGQSMESQQYNEMGDMVRDFKNSLETGIKKLLYFIPRSRKLDISDPKDKKLKSQIKKQNKEVKASGIGTLQDEDNVPVLNSLGDQTFYNIDDVISKVLSSLRGKLFDNTEKGLEEFIKFLKTSDTPAVNQFGKLLSSFMKESNPELNKQLQIKAFKAFNVHTQKGLTISVEVSKLKDNSGKVVKDGDLAYDVKISESDNYIKNDKLYNNLQFDFLNNNYVDEEMNPLITTYVNSVGVEEKKINVKVASKLLDTIKHIPKAMRDRIVLERQQIKNLDKETDTESIQEVYEISKEKTERSLLAFYEVIKKLGINVQFNSYVDSILELGNVNNHPIINEVSKSYYVAQGLNSFYTILRKGMVTDNNTNNGNIFIGYQSTMKNIFAKNEAKYSDVNETGVTRIGQKQYNPYTRKSFLTDIFDKFEKIKIEIASINEELSDPKNESKFEKLNKKKEKLISQLYYGPFAQNSLFKELLSSNQTKNINIVSLNYILNHRSNVKKGENKTSNELLEIEKLIEKMLNHQNNGDKYGVYNYDTLSDKSVDPTLKFDKIPLRYGSGTLDNNNYVISTSSLEYLHKYFKNEYNRILNTQEINKSKKITNNDKIANYHTFYDKNNNPTSIGMGTFFINLPEMNYDMLFLKANSEDVSEKERVNAKRALELLYDIDGNLKNLTEVELNDDSIFNIINDNFKKSALKYKKLFKNKQVFTDTENKSRLFSNKYVKSESFENVFLNLLESDDLDAFENNNSQIKKAFNSFKNTLNLEVFRKDFPYLEDRLIDYMIADLTFNETIKSQESFILTGDPAQEGKSTLKNNDAIKFIENRKDYNNSELDLNAKMEKVLTNVNELYKSFYETSLNVSKRNAAFSAAGDVGVYSKLTYKIAFAKDIKINNTNSEFFKELVNAYKGVIDTKVLQKAFVNGDIADAQEITTLFEHLSVMRGESKIDNKQLISAMYVYDRYGYDSIIEKYPQYKNLSPTEMKNIAETVSIVPMKPVQRVSTFSEKLKMRREYYVKSSAIPIIPSMLPESSPFRKIVTDMYDKGVDRLTFNSGVKIGLSESKDLFNPDGSYNEDFFNNNSHELDRNGFRIQLNVPYSEKKDEITTAVQQKRMLFANLKNKWKAVLNGKNVTVKDLKNEYNNLYRELYNIQLTKLKKELKIGDNNTFSDLSVLSKILKAEGLDRDYNLNTIKGFELSSNKKNFKIPLTFSLNSHQIEPVISAIIKHRLAKTKMPGFSRVQATEIILGGNIKQRGEVISGDNLEQFGKSDIIWAKPEYQNIQSLSFTTKKIENNKEERVYAQVITSNFITINGKKVDLLSKDSNNNYIYLDNELAKQNRFVLNDKVDSKILQINGFRIPFQGHNSGNWIEIVGFLPNSMKELMIVPGEIAGQMGSDYDVDKLYSYVYNYYLDSLNNIKAIDEKTTVDDILQSRNILLSKINKLIPNGVELEDVFPEINYYSDNIEPIRVKSEFYSLRNKIIKNLNFNTDFLLIPVEEDLKLMKVQNGIIDIIKTVYNLEENYNNVRKPATTDLITDAIKTVDELVLSKGGSTNNLNLRETFLGLQDPTHQFNLYYYNRDGKIGVSLTSLAATGHSMAQNSNLFINKKSNALKFVDASGTLLSENLTEEYLEDDTTTYEKLDKPYKTIYGLEENSKINGLFRLDKISSISRIKNVIVNGKLVSVKTPVYDISDMINQLQSVSLDNAKDLLLASMNITKQTFPVANLMVRAGLDFELIKIYLNQPIIKEFLQELSAVENLYDTIYLADKFKSIRDNIVKEYVEQFELDGLTERELTNSIVNIPAMENAYVEDAITVDNFIDQISVINSFIINNETATEIQSLMSDTNTDSKGPGKNLSDVRKKAENIQDRYTKDSSKKILGNDLRFISENASGAVTNVSSLMMELFSSSKNPLFAYDSFTYKEIYERLLTFIGRDNFYNETIDIVNNNIIMAIYSAFAGQKLAERNISVDAYRYYLLYGSQDERGKANSLFNRIKNFTKNNNDYYILNNVSTLMTAKKGLDVGDYFRFSSNTENSHDTNIIKSFWELLSSSNVENAEAKKLAEDLVMYILLVSPQQYGENNMVKFIPNEYITSSGFSSFLNSVHTSLFNLNPENDAITYNMISNLPQQILQHAPELTINIKESDIIPGSIQKGYYIVYGSNGEESIFDRGIERFELPNPSSKNALKRLVREKVVEEIDETTGQNKIFKHYPLYISVFEDGKKVLFKSKGLTEGFENVVYERVESLGDSSSSEYNLFNPEQKSIYLFNKNTNTENQVTNDRRLLNEALRNIALNYNTQDIGDIIDDPRKILNRAVNDRVNNEANFKLTNREISKYLNDRIISLNLIKNKTRKQIDEITQLRELLILSKNFENYDSGKLPLLGSIKFKLDSESNQPGYYDSATNTIYINFKAAHTNSNLYGVSAEMFLIRTMMHEMTHALIHHAPKENNEHWDKIEQAYNFYVNDIRDISAKGVGIPKKIKGLVDASLTKIIVNEIATDAEQLKTFNLYLNAISNGTITHASQDLSKEQGLNFNVNITSNLVKAIKKELESLNDVRTRYIDEFFNLGKSDEKLMEYVFEEYMNNIGNKMSNYYAYSNIKEYVAETISNPIHVKNLVKIKSNLFISTLKALIDFIKDLFNVSNKTESNLFEDSLVAIFNYVNLNTTQEFRDNIDEEISIVDEQLKTYVNNPIVVPYEQIKKELNDMIIAQTQILEDQPGPIRYEYEGRSINTPFELSDKQNEALSKMVDFVNNISANKFVLKGPSNSGKTNLISLLDKYFRNREDVEFIPFGSSKESAVKLHLNTLKYNNDVPRSITEYIKYGDGINSVTSMRDSFNNYVQSISGLNKVLLIDEAHKLNNEQINAIEKYVNDYNNFSENVERDKTLQIIYFTDPTLGYMEDFENGEVLRNSLEKDFQDNIELPINNSNVIKELNDVQSYFADNINKPEVVKIPETSGVEDYIDSEGDLIEAPYKIEEFTKDYFNDKAVDFQGENGLDRVILTTNLKDARTVNEEIKKQLIREDVWNSYYTVGDIITSNNQTFNRGVFGKGVPLGMRYLINNFKPIVSNDKDNYAVVANITLISKDLNNSSIEGYKNAEKGKVKKINIIPLSLKDAEDLRLTSVSQEDVDQNVTIHNAKYQQYLELREKIGNEDFDYKTYNSLLDYFAENVTISDYYFNKGEFKKENIGFNDRVDLDKIVDKTSRSILHRGIELGFALPVRNANGTKFNKVYSLMKDFSNVKFKNTQSPKRFNYNMIMQYMAVSKAVNNFTILTGRTFFKNEGVVSTIVRENQNEQLNNNINPQNLTGDNFENERITTNTLDKLLLSQQAQQTDNNLNLNEAKLKVKEIVDSKNDPTFFEKFYENLTEDNNLRFIENLDLNYAELNIVDNSGIIEQGLEITNAELFKSYIEIMTAIGEDVSDLINSIFDNKIDKFVNDINQSLKSLKSLNENTLTKLSLDYLNSLKKC